MSQLNARTQWQDELSGEQTYHGWVRTNLVYLFLLSLTLEASQLNLASDIIADEQTTQTEGEAKGVQITTTVVTDSDGFELSTRGDNGKRGSHSKRPSMDYKRRDVLEAAATPRDLTTIVIGKREHGHSYDDGLSLRSLGEESFAKASELESQGGLSRIEPAARPPTDRQKDIGWRNML
jgi:hypothetical protein